jgi:hypothetical protein
MTDMDSRDRCKGIWFSRGIRAGLAANGTGLLRDGPELETERLSRVGDCAEAREPTLTMSCGKGAWGWAECAA